MSTAKRPRRQRREPKQVRSTKRLEEILEATGRLLDRVGYEATTTTAIAREAKASVGTVYEYFPDRDALVRALLERYRTRLRRALEEVLAGVDQRTWRATAARAVATFADFYRREPGYRVLWLESETTPALRDAGASWGEEFGAMLEPLIAAFAPALPPLERRAVARTSMYLVSGLVSAALVGPQELCEPMLRETERALGSYLAEVLRSRAARQSSHGKTRAVRAHRPRRRGAVTPGT